MTIRTASVGALLLVMLVATFGSVGGTTLLPAARASEAAPGATSIRAALEQQAGKRAKLQMVSGDPIEGRVQSVGDEVVVVAELAGMEYFSATVRIDQVAAVIARTTSP